MLAIARAFIGDHKLLLIDEPSKGLAPIVVDHSLSR
jgi:branched-chain amino acid transport system ATP-binding protein